VPVMVGGFHVSGTLAMLPDVAGGVTGNTGTAERGR
jgi:hypothetical protein